jgi:hypothetical protein
LSSVLGRYFFVRHDRALVAITPLLLKLLELEFESVELFIEF